jgi:hypothetical protein
MLQKKSLLIGLLVLCCSIGAGCPADSDPSLGGGGGESGPGGANEAEALVDRSFEAEYRADKIECECTENADDEDCPAARKSTERIACIKKQVVAMWSDKLAKELRCMVENQEARVECISKQSSCGGDEDACSDQPDCPDDEIDKIDDCD